MNKNFLFLAFVLFFSSVSIVNAQQSRVKYNFNPEWKFTKANPTNAQVINSCDFELRKIVSRIVKT